MSNFKTFNDVSIDTINLVNTNLLSGGQAVSIGGTSSVVSGLNSAVVGGSNNTVSGSNSGTLGGTLNNATGVRSVSIGGTLNEATGLNSSVLGGNEGIASGENAIVIGGMTNRAVGVRSVIVGGLNSSCSGNNSVFCAGMNTDLTIPNTLGCGLLKTHGGTIFPLRVIDENILYQATDNDRYIMRTNAVAINLTLPPLLTVEFDGFGLTIISALGAGAITLVLPANVLISGSDVINTNTSGKFIHRRVGIDSVWYRIR